MTKLFTPLPGTLRLPLKPTVAALLALSLQVHAAGFAQTITLTEKNAPLDRVLRDIQRQSSYTFLYNTQMVRAARPVTLSVRNAPLEQVLAQVMAEQALTYTISGNSIIIKPKEATTTRRPTPPATVIGIVTDADGNPLPGVTIRVKNTQLGTATDVNGHYQIRVDDADEAVLVFSFIGYEPQEIRVAGQSSIAVRLLPAQNNLNDVVVVGYGTTTQRNNTGAVSTITSETIAEQPVSNPLQALQGRLAGVQVTPATGFGGAAMNVRIRGNNSLLAGNDPLYVVDGVPYPANGLNNFSAFGAFAQNGSYDSPLNSINPADILRIDILKDADATAIYGSRGANGVVLITTRKGSTGKGKLDVNVYSGAGKATRLLDMMNTEQYLAMRREGFANDNITPTPSNAPDLTTFDQTAYTDWQKKLLGGTASVTDAEASFSAGTAQTKFALSGGYRHEGTIYPGNYGVDRANGRLTVSHSSLNNRVGVDATVGYVNTVNKLATTDFTTLITLPPNYNPYNADGTLYWVSGIDNPYAYLQRGIRNTSRNLLSNVAFRLQILDGLSFKTSVGLNRLTMDQFSPRPASSVSTLSSARVASAEFGTGSTTTYLAEPQLDYVRQLGGGSLQALVGGTFQQTADVRQYIYATDYVSDAALSNITLANTKTYYNDDAYKYRYGSLFGRVTYNWKGKYILNGTFRRDGSSKFGPNNRFGNFGAGGAAWVFSEESFVKDGLPFLSFGKLRGSYGVTGNDQSAGYYDYLSTFRSTGRLTYGSLVGLVPSRLGNPDYRWETVRKLDVALELGFLDNRLLLTADYYRSISTDQLVGFITPTQTGFSSITANLPAKVLNQGLELTLNTTNVQGKDFTWSSALNLTVPENKLLEYPNLEGSSYARQFIVGQPTTITKGFDYEGVNPETGLATGGYVSPAGVFTGSYNTTTVVLNQGYPKFYGGLNNSLQYKGFTLDFFLQFTKQTARNYVPYAPPGQGLSNAPTWLLDRWRQPGDVAGYPRATATFGTAYNTFFNYTNSKEAYGDASFLRLKTLALSYRVPQPVAQKLHLQNLRVYAQGQNLLTITNYRGFDPEVPGLVLPPMRLLTGGIQFAL
ncbi:TonB-dependent receptor [Hymenobacter aerilatus]|uniref:TonB-dependent receptor n=1 Tax=Hymenobacter aerilatus TaxID=2932251 RepID=A0A8T9ST51_9BACT|nr:TonB-dependent receptor [Hymenobacter aerilatus]UOR03903.1 TonB-dependent receptor [Hymenobacter aerilatus]